MNNKVAPAIGWISLALLASVTIWLFALFVSSNLNTDEAISRMGFGLIVSLLSVVFVTVLRRYSKNPRNVGLYDLAKKFLIGVAWYGVPAALGLIVVSLTGTIEVSVNGSFMNIASTVLLVTALVFLSEALPEEIIFRGYIFSKLTTFSGRWVTILLQAAIFLIFAFMIGALDNWLDASFIFTFGISLGILRAAVGSVAAPIGFHLACMTMQQSFSSQWSPFTVADPAILQTYIFGMMPISITIAYYATKIPNKGKD